MNQSYNNEEDLDHEQQNEQFGRQGIIYLIDCREEMFKKDLKLNCGLGDECSAFKLSLKCCREVMLQKMKSEIDAVISVVLFGISDDQADNQFTVELTPLSVCNPEIIKSLDEVMASDDDDFLNKYKQKSEPFLAEALSFCLFSFNRSVYKFGTMRIVLFTKDDNPNADSSTVQHQIRKRVSDLKEANIDFNLIPFGPSFQIAKFFEEVITSNGAGFYDFINPVDSGTDFLTILNLLNKVNCKNSTIAHLKFHIGSKHFGVGLYGFASKKRRCEKRYLSRKTNEPVKSARLMIENETGNVIRPYEVVKTVSIDTTKLVFTKDDFKRIKGAFEPGLTLLGFRPKSCWNVNYQCHPPFLIVADNSIEKGSAKILKALLKGCSMRNVVAVCVLVSRTGSRPRYVILVPNENVSSEPRQLSPGFCVYFLPFRRMIRTIPRNIAEIEEDQTSETLVMSRIIKKIRSEFSLFENPTLGNLWLNIEALALHNARPEQFVDATVTPVEKLSEKLQDLSVEFNNLFPAEKEKPRGTKRKLPSSSKVASKK